MIRSALTLSAVLIFGSGCYTWHEVAPDSLAPGVDVRVTLDRQTALQRLEESGEELRTTVSGTVTDQTNDRSIGLTTRVRGSTFNQFEMLPRAGVLRIEEKRFSAARTGGLAALGVGATIAILSVIEGQTDEGIDGPPIDESRRVRIPIFSIGR